MFRPAGCHVGESFISSDASETSDLSGGGVRNLGIGSFLVAAFYTFFADYPRGIDQASEREGEVGLGGYPDAVPSWEGVDPSCVIHLLPPSQTHFSHSPLPPHAGEIHRNFSSAIVFYSDCY